MCFLKVSATSWLKAWGLLGSLFWTYLVIWVGIIGWFRVKILDSSPDWDSAGALLPRGL